MTPIIDKAKLAEVCARPLYRGHHYPNGKTCLLEAVAYITGESWSDHPECVCPILAAFGRSWNDALNNADRQMLKPYITRLVGTRSTPEVESRRSWMALDWMIREYTPAWLRLTGLTKQAEQVEGLAAVIDTVSVKATHRILNAARKDSAAAWAAAGSAAGSAAWDAAGSAARAAAWDAAWAAAGAAARDAAGAAAWAAAGAAAWAAAGAAALDAAGAAAGAAARDAARDALAPTTNALQVSAISLFDRMIDAA